ncbi:hypothetical protein VTN02DRAFT_519 [Thermoascus thermophilus]
MQASCNRRDAIPRRSQAARIVKSRGQQLTKRASPSSTGHRVGRCGGNVGEAAFGDAGRSIISGGLSSDLALRMRGSLIIGQQGWRINFAALRRSAGGEGLYGSQAQWERMRSGSRWEKVAMELHGAMRDASRQTTMEEYMRDGARPLDL